MLCNWLSTVTDAFVSFIFVISPTGTVFFLNKKNTTNPPITAAPPTDPVTAPIIRPLLSLSESPIITWSKISESENSTDALKFDEWLKVTDELKILDCVKQSESVKMLDWINTSDWVKTEEPVNFDDWLNSSDFVNFWEALKTPKGENSFDDVNSFEPLFHTDWVKSADLLKTCYFEKPSDELNVFFFFHDIFS